jgi:hypothetical protein
MVLRSSASNAWHRVAALSTSPRRKIPDGDIGPPGGFQRLLRRWVRQGAMALQGLPYHFGNVEEADLPREEQIHGGLVGAA